MKPPSFEVLAGTYEEFLLGYYFIPEQLELVQSIAAHDHSGSIRSIAVSGQYLATGSIDDRIIIYDLKSRKEHCMLTHHNATVNCLQFTNNHSQLISGSSDGILAIIRVGNWQLEKLWEKAHKGAAVLDVAVHSSGKLALTLGADCSLRTWNLVKGRQAYVINLNSKSKDARSLDKIMWAEDGTRFILYGGKYTEVWSIESGGILEVIEHKEKVSSCIWLSSDEALVGYENGDIALVNVNDGTKSFRKAHNGRVKALAAYDSWIVSGSSSGEIKVWTMKLKEIAKQDSGCRITCLKIVPSINIKKEEKEEMLEEIEEQTVSNPVKKSSVVVEVEGSDEGSVYKTLSCVLYTTKVKQYKHKESRVEYVLEESETHLKSKPKKKKRKLISAKETEVVPIKKQEKSKIKKSQKQREIINKEVVAAVTVVENVNIYKDNNTKKRKRTKYIRGAKVADIDRNSFKKSKKNKIL